MRKMMSLCYYNFLGARNLKPCFLFVFGHLDEPRNLMGHSTRFRHNGPEVWSWCGAFDLPEISWPELIFNAFFWELEDKVWSRGLYGGVHLKTKGIYYETRLNSSLALHRSGDVEKGRLLTYLYVWAHQVYSIYMMGKATSHHYHALGCLYLLWICFEIGSILWN